MVSEADGNTRFSASATPSEAATGTSVAPTRSDADKSGRRCHPDLAPVGATMLVPRPLRRADARLSGFGARRLSLPNKPERRLNEAHTRAPNGSVARCSTPNDVASSKDDQVPDATSDETTGETFQIPLEAAEMYEAKFVPALFAEWAPRLIEIAAVKPGDACSTWPVGPESSPAPPPAPSDRTAASWASI